MQSGKYLFVYGTLRSESGNEMHQFLAENARLCGRGFFHGDLYLVSYYPCVVKSDVECGKVTGEIYDLKNEEFVLARLDEYEECSEKFPQPREYVRAIEEITMENGMPIKAWIYLYNRSTEGLSRIASGDFYLDVKSA
jgi:gamma-glutamylcyclotransferase (GGCT)/AIG2-like uncharacterized protein YtfP